MSISSCSSTCSFSEGRYQSNTTSTPTTPSEHRWSDVIPPKTALKFAVVWDSDDLVVFSGGELLEDSRTEELLLGSPLSPSDACSQAFSVGQSTMLLSDKSSTMLYFRDNMGSVLAENHSPSTSDSEKRMILGRTQTSSTMEGLDVYLRGSLMGQAHRNNRYYSCLDNLDGQFEFDPRTSFAKEYLRKVEGKDIVDDAVTDEGFFEVEIAPRQHQILAKTYSRCDIHPTDAHSVASSTKTSDFVSIEGDDASSIWSTIETPVLPSYLGYTSMDQRPRLKRRLTKPRPADIPAPPSEVLKRENIFGLPSPESLASSIPATCSPVTPEDAETFVFSSKESAETALDDVFTGGRSYFQKTHYREDRTYLPPLSEVSDQGSIYSQDSACVVYTSQLRAVTNPTPQSTLTFAAIWDPDHGMSTFSGKQLIGQEYSSQDERGEDGESTWVQEGNYNTCLSTSHYHNSEHPDCEPHLHSRFSTTTTSTSNYIEVALGEEDRINLSSKPLQDDLLPGDSHPAWIPQIFTVGFTKPSSYGPGRPEISEPFQLTPVRPPELKNHTLPSHFSLTSKSSSLLTRSRLHISSSVAAANPTSSSTPSREDMSGTHSSPTASVRRGFSFGSGHIQRNDHAPPFSSTHSRNAEESSESSALGSVISRPQTPTRRPSITSVFGKLKSPRKGQSEPWVMVDVEVTPMIHQRLVTEY
ncbi:hypothetical protein F5876DRAFT_73242 [Lentinula aff. lateritia]|uniref:Uncharacterized protein n=1 Tax=Lentinula aff. lateritia TaxID=2804960 RepID=A0ACC1UB85_9AGAR|nr:hypothetical protein F5876DRAFT_73242 [Lentinula aff. lateritia]